jgi:hypothetical protein
MCGGTGVILATLRDSEIEALIALGETVKSKLPSGVSAGEAAEIVRLAVIVACKTPTPEAPDD